MEHVNEQHDDLIDLGVASAETKGPPGPIVDFLGSQPDNGLAHDD